MARVNKVGIRNRINKEILVGQSKETRSSLPEHLTTRETAALARRTEKCMRNRAYLNKPPLPRRVGGRLLWHRDEVLRWLDGEEC